MLRLISPPPTSPSSSISPTVQGKVVENSFSVSQRSCTSWATSKLEAAHELEQPPARAAALQIALDAALIVELDLAGLAVDVLRHAVEIAGDRLLGAVEQQIKPRPAMRRAAHHHVGEPAQARAADTARRGPRSPRR